MSRIHYSVTDGLGDSSDFVDFADAAQEYQRQRSLAETDDIVSLLRITSEVLVSEPGELPPLRWVEDDPAKPPPLLSALFPEVQVPRGGIVYRPAGSDE